MKLSELKDVYKRQIHFNSLNLRTGHHTVAYFSIGEIKGILEYLHLVINFIFIARTRREQTASRIG